MKKNFITMLVTILLMILPMTASAAVMTNQNVTELNIGGTNALTTTSGSGWAYYSGSYLALTNYSGASSTVSVTADKLNIACAGLNRIGKLTIAEDSSVYLLGSGILLVDEVDWYSGDLKLYEGGTVALFVKQDGVYTLVNPESCPGIVDSDGQYTLPAGNYLIPSGTKLTLNVVCMKDSDDNVSMGNSDLTIPRGSTFTVKGKVTMEAGKYRPDLLQYGYAFPTELCSVLNVRGTLKLESGADFYSGGIINVTGQGKIKCARNAAIKGNYSYSSCFDGTSEIANAMINYNTRDSTSDIVIGNGAELYLFDGRKVNSITANGGTATVHVKSHKARLTINTISARASSTLNVYGYYNTIIDNKTLSGSGDIYFGDIYMITGGTASGTVPKIISGAIVDKAYKSSIASQVPQNSTAFYIDAKNLESRYLTTSTNEYGESETKLTVYLGCEQGCSSRGRYFPYSDKALRTYLGGLYYKDTTEFKLRTSISKQDLAEIVDLIETIVADTYHYDYANYSDFSFSSYFGRTCYASYGNVSFGENAGDSSSTLIVIGVDSQGNPVMNVRSDSGMSKVCLLLAKATESVTMREGSNAIVTTVCNTTGSGVLGGSDPDSMQSNSASSGNANAGKEKHTHSFSAPTCTKPATCSCGQTTGTTIAHTPGRAATCTAPQKCTKCGTVLTAAKGHTKGAAATCTEPQKCTVCGIVLTAAKGHTKGADATCTQAQKCTVCSAIIAEAKGHTKGRAATCTEAQKCTVCGETLARAKGHTKGSAATCTEPQKCTVCGEILVRRKGHKEGADATCTTDQKCTVCGEVLTERKGHTPGERATCTKDQKCTVCNEILTNATGHTKGKAATCTEPQKCTVCGEVLAKATGHSFGINSEKCSLCGAVNPDYESRSSQSENTSSDISQSSESEPEESESTVSESQDVTSQPEKAESDSSASARESKVESANNGSGEEKGSFPVGGIVCGAGALGLLFFIIAKRRKDDDEEEK